LVDYVEEAVHDWRFYDVDEFQDFYKIKVCECCDRGKNVSTPKKDRDYGFGLDPDDGVTNAGRKVV
jgi:hypothetical protein